MREAVKQQYNSKSSESKINNFSNKIKKKLAISGIANIKLICPYNVSVRHGMGQPVQKLKLFKTELIECHNFIILYSRCMRCTKRLAADMYTWLSRGAIIVRSTLNRMGPHKALTGVLTGALTTMEF